MALAPIQHNAVRIWSQVRGNNAAGDRLGNVYCCLEHWFVNQARFGTAMEFQTAMRYARRKRLILE